MQEQETPGWGEAETLPGGGITVGDAVPEMPPGSAEESDEDSVDEDGADEDGADEDGADEEPDGGLSRTNLNS